MAYTANLIPDMTSATAPSGTVTSSGDLNTSYANWKAFDKINDAFGWAVGHGNATQWVGYQFTSGVVATQYVLTSRNEATVPRSNRSTPATP